MSRESATTSPPASDESVAFIERLGRALHLAGAPSQRIEEALVGVAAHLGLAGQFFATPTALFASLRSNTISRTVLLRVDPGSIDLERLELVESVYVDLLRGRSDSRGRRSGSMRPLPAVPATAAR